MRSVADRRPARVPVGESGAWMLPLGLGLFERGIQRYHSLRRATDEARGRRMGPRSDKGDGDPNQDPDPPMAATPSDPTT